jgi:hypothetical protein
MDSKGTAISSPTLIKLVDMVTNTNESCDNKGNILA